MIGVLSSLLRPKLALMNAVTAVSGYLLFPADVVLLPLSALFCGVTLLAAGGSALNQVLERDIDGLMTRTRLRPLPQGKLSPLAATLTGAATIMAGLALLWTGGGLTASLFGVVTLMWYLMVYTPLKRQTPCALLAGAICGALSPAIGWSLAGGHFFDYRIVLFSGMIYLWQIPHFWLLQRRHADDYRAAGIPLFNASEAGFGFMRIWIMAFIAAAMLLPVFAVIEKHVSVCYAMLLLPLILLTLLRHEKILYTYLNLFPVLISLVLCFR